MKPIRSSRNAWAAGSPRSARGRNGRAVVWSCALGVLPRRRSDAGHASGLPATSSRRLSCSSWHAGSPRGARASRAPAVGGTAGELELDVLVEPLEALSQVISGPRRAEQASCRHAAAPRRSLRARRAGSCRARRASCRAARRARRSAPRRARARRTPRAGAGSAASGPRPHRAQQLRPLEPLVRGRAAVGDLGPALGARATSRPCHARRRAFTPASSSANL